MEFETALSTKEALSTIQDYFIENKDCRISTDLENLLEVLFDPDEMGGAYDWSNDPAICHLSSFEIEQDEKKLFRGDITSGIFGAIQFLKEKQEDETGKMFTDVTDPVGISSSIWYIRGEKATALLADKMNIDKNTLLDDEQAPKVIKACDELMQEY